MAGRARRWVAPAVVVVVAAAIGSGAVVLLVGDGDAASASVSLEPAGTAGPDPFTESVTVGDVPGGDAPATPTADLAPDPATGGVRAVGTEPGLYGGSQDDDVCDPEQLVEYLTANRDKARAWAGVLGIQPREIEDYVSTLTPVVLTVDTRVTNHGFRDGRATARDAVLQSGTAVLVDARGVPRVKCGCGNPLGPAASTAIGTTTGTAWPSFTPETVTTVAAAPRPATSLTLTEIGTGEPIRQAVGPPGKIRSVDFGNRTYTGEGDCQPEVTLVDGRWEQTTSGSLSYTEWYTAETHYADVTGDGEEDAVVEFVYFGGGNATFACLSVFSMEGDEPVEVGTIDTSPAGTGSIVLREVGPRGIVVTEPRHSRSDPRCCPSQLADVRYEYRNGVFVIADEQLRQPAG